MHSVHVSIIIPFYNREKQLSFAIESVLSQSYTNYELILVDDCSTDRSVEVVNSYQDPRIKLIQCARNSGPAHARNMGIQASIGALISFLDSDDRYLPGFLLSSVNKFRTVDASIGFIWVGYRVVDGNGGLIKDVVWNPSRSGDQYLGFLKELKIGTGCGLTFRRQVLEKVKLNSKLRAAEDTEFFLRVVQKYRYDYVENVLISICKHSEHRVTSNHFETLYTYLVIFSLHKKAIYNDIGLKIKFFEKIISLSYKINRKKRARKLLMIGAPQTLLSIQILAKFVLFEFKSLLALPPMVFLILPVTFTP